MVYLGHVECGKVILDDAVALPDGTAVTVAVVRRDDAASADAVVGQSGPTEGPTDKQTFLERYAKYIGIVEGMPADLAKNHDHYLYGTPKE